MRQFLFYKIVSSDAHETKVEYRRLQDGVVHEGLPNAMKGTITFQGECNERRIRTYAITAGWLSHELPINADSEVGQAALQGRW